MELGIAFEDTLTGRTYVPIEIVEKLASELGFEIFKCHAPDEIPDIPERERRLIECYQKLAPHIDAFYMTAHNALTLKTLPGVLAPLFKYKVTTFAQRGAKEVKHGVLMSMAQENFQLLGRFHAETFARILNGAKPRNLPQVFESPPAIAINLETARKIGFRFPLDILAGAKEIYEHIESVE